MDNSTTTSAAAEPAPATDAGTAPEPTTTPEPAASEAASTAQAPDGTHLLMDHEAWVAREHRNTALAHAVATVHKLIEHGSGRTGTDAGERITDMADRFEAWLSRGHTPSA